MPKQFNQNSRIVPINFRKKFSSLDEMISEFKEIHPEMGYIFNYDKYDNSVSDAIYDVITYFNQEENFPSLNKRYNPSLNVSINKLELKTNKFFSFKWEYKYNKEGYITSDFYATLTAFKGNYASDEIKDMIDYLENKDNGWEKVEFTKRKPTYNKNNRKYNYDKNKEEE